MSDYLEILNNMSFCLLMAFAVRLGWDYKNTWCALCHFWNKFWERLFIFLLSLFRKRKP